MTGQRRRNSAGRDLKRNNHLRTGALARISTNRLVYMDMKPLYHWSRWCPTVGNSLMDRRRSVSSPSEVVNGFALLTKDDRVFVETTRGTITAQFIFEQFEQLSLTVGRSPIRSLITYVGRKLSKNE